MIKTTYTKEQVSNMIRDYNWILREIEYIRNELNDVDLNVTSQYGEESAMPKAKGDPVDMMTFEIIRRDKKSKRAERLENKIKFIRDNIHKIKDERQRVVLDHLLDGMSITKLSHHMGISRKQVYKIKDEIIDELLKD